MHIQSHVLPTGVVHVIHCDHNSICRTLQLIAGTKLA